MTPHGVVRGGLAVRNGTILHVGADATLPRARREVDAEGAYLVPGLIDPHVHIGAAAEEGALSNFSTETESAAVSGVTTFMAYLRCGAILEPRLPVYRRIRTAGEERSWVDFKFHAYLVTEDHLREIPGLVAEGITSAKLLLGYREEEARRSGMHAVDLGFALRAMELLAPFGPPVLLQAHCEEPDVSGVLTDRLRAEGRTDFPAWAESRPALCEAIHAYGMGLLSLRTGCPLYVVHASATETLDIIRYLRARGARISAETCTHYLFLTGRTPLGVLAKIAPPLREEGDIASLWKGLAEGTLDTVGSDHCARTRKDKEEAGVWGGVPGAGGVGAILPLLVSEGVNKGRITIEQFVKLTSENAARLWGLFPKKGALGPGSDADIVVLDPRREWVLTAAALKSCCDYSLYEGWPVKGKAEKVFLRGELLAEDGELVAEKPRGRFVHPLMKTT